MARIVTSLMHDWEFSDDREPGRWRRIDLPHDWAIERPIKAGMPWGSDQAFRDRWGIGWYRKKVQLDTKSSGRSYWIHSDGIYECSTIYVNGIKVGGHAYGYSPFSCEITEALHPGNNLLLIRVDNTRTPSDRWYSGAGICRQLDLIEASLPHLDQERIQVRQKIDLEKSQADLLCQIPLISSPSRQDSEPLRIRICLLNREGVKVASAESKPEETLEVKVSQAHLWSAEDPYLYRLQVKLLSGDALIDNLEQSVGFRQVCFDADQGMLVNGTKTIFKGVCIHQDLGCMGAVRSPDLLRQRLLILKKMGCNGIRAAHHAHPKELLDLCDELGFYVYDEAFDKWLSGHDGNFFRDHWREDLAALMFRDRNHPSVIIWGLGNEVEHQSQPSMLDILSQMVSLAHQLDPDRPASCALSPHFQQAEQVNHGDGVIQATDDVCSETEITDLNGIARCIAAVARVSDLVAVNYSEQWYERIHELIPDKPIFGSEVYQYFSGHPDQMQNFTDSNPNLVPMRLPYVVGGAVWAGFDYLGESMGYPSKGWSGALVRTSNTPKTGYYLLQSYWSQEPMVHFTVLDYSQPDELVKEHWDIPPYMHHWDFPEIKRGVIPYMVTTNCDSVRIFLNEKEYHVGLPGEDKNHYIRGFLPYQPGSVRVEGYREGKKVCEEVISTPGRPAKLLFEPNANIGHHDSQPPALPGQSEGEVWPADRDFRQMVELRCTDSTGSLCFRSSPLINFKVEGPIRLMGLDDGCLLHGAEYGSNQVSAYQGRCSMVIGGSGSCGHARVIASAQGLDSAVLECLMT